VSRSREGADAGTTLAAAMAQLAAWHAEQGPVSGRGFEALIAGATLACGRSTWLLPGERERGCALLRGASPDAVDAARPYRVVPPGTSPVARAAYAVGLASRGDRALVFCGTGTVGYGAWTEAVSLAVQLGAEVVFLVAAYADAEGSPGADAPFAVQLSGGAAAVARGMGAAGVVVDGRDADAVHAAVKAASGPTVIEARLRLGA
jgi:TPP-dependent pyruvate/acetoin dehydrogenase alpha subunit